MTASYILEQIANGIILGSMYALIAIGFSLIYGIVRLINFAHGDIVTIGAFAMLASITAFHAPFPVAVLVVLAVGAVVGMLIERIAFRPMRGAPQVTGFIASLADLVRRTLACGPGLCSHAGGPMCVGPFGDCPFRARIPEV